MTAADIVRVDKLAEKSIVSIQEAVSLDYSRGNANLLAWSIGVCARQSTKSRLGAALNSALMLVPAVNSKNVCVAEVVDFLIPMRAENAVEVSRCRQNSLDCKGKNNIAVKALLAEQNTTLVASLTTYEPAVLSVPLPCHHLPIPLPIGIGGTAKNNGTILKLNQFSKQTQFFHTNISHVFFLILSKNARFVKYQAVTPSQKSSRIVSPDKPWLYKRTY